MYIKMTNTGNNMKMSYDVVRQQAVRIKKWSAVDNTTAIFLYKLKTGFPIVRDVFCTATLKKRVA